MKTNQGVENNAVKAVTSACVASCQKLAARIEQAKEQLLVELQETLQVPDKLFKLALNEAEALAWQTEYPHLVFPVLAAEKIQAAGKWNARQEFRRHKNSIYATSI
ncbi:MAG TPA: hypothetical protein VMA35_06835 [Candidatus Sulfopaludibacter sp.]|nr:hypothetical protein [Candidatus Sulfopaludibacter sp.]